jgi:hypothetical protein
MTALIRKTAWALALALTLSSAACRPAPPTLDGSIDVALPEECRGSTPELIASGARVTLVLSRAGRLFVVDFVGGRLDGVSELVGDAAPRLESRGDLICAAGEWPEDECLRALWREGACWVVR